MFDSSERVVTGSSLATGWEAPSNRWPAMRERDEIVAQRSIPEPIMRLLDPEEELHSLAEAIEATIAVTAHRLIVAENERIVLDVPIAALRRLEFDIERDRPATLVIVPHSPENVPQLLSIPVSEYAAAAQALVVIGTELASQPA